MESRKSLDIITIWGMTAEVRKCGILRRFANFRSAKITKLQKISVKEIFT